MNRRKAALSRPCTDSASASRRGGMAREKTAMAAPQSVRISTQSIMEPS